MTSPRTKAESLSPTDRNQRTILITGGAGFIGSHFVRHILKQEQNQVVNLDALTYAGNLASLADVEDEAGYHFVHGDICDGDLLSEVFQAHRPWAVVNLAAESHVDKSIAAPDQFVHTNVVGTAQLLKRALAYWEELPATERDAFRFLHVSTDEVFGSLGPDGRFSETSPYRPNSPYSASKAASDHLVRAWHTTYGLPTLISNCSNNYGPNQYPEKLIPLMTLNAAAGRALPVYGDGMNIRDWLHVTDHCEALWQILHRGTPGNDYCVGGSTEKTNLEVVRAICRLVDELLPSPTGTTCERMIAFVPDRPGHDRRYAVDAAKISRELGWKPQVDFDTGLRETVAWYLKNTNWVEQVQRKRESN